MGGRRWRGAGGVGVLEEEKEEEEQQQEQEQEEQEISNMRGAEVVGGEGGLGEIMM